MQKQLLKWTTNFQRYDLTCIKHIYNNHCKLTENNLKQTRVAKAQHLNPVSNVTQHYKHLDKICLQSNSKLLHDTIEHYNTFYQTFNIITSGQCPQAIKSKRSEAAFKLIKGQTFGLSNDVRKKKMLGLSYKWFFIAPNLEHFKLQKRYISKKNRIYGINNIFIFECDRLNYQTFEKMTGLDICFSFKTKLSNT